MQTRDANLLGAAPGWDLNPSMLSERLIVLGNLVALRQIGIEIIFTGKDRCLINPAIDRHGREHSELHRLAVQNRQSTGQAEADGADVAVRGIAETGRA